MNAQDMHDSVYAIEIGLDAEEEELGLIGGRYIRWKAASVYIYEAVGGRVFIGFCAHPNSDVARGLARRRAMDGRIRYLDRVRGPVA